jgi:hypothetical protein
MASVEWTEAFWRANRRLFACASSSSLACSTLPSAHNAATHIVYGIGLYMLRPSPLHPVGLSRLTAAGRQRRTTPAVSPPMKLRWSTRNSSSGGRITIAMPAKVRP